MQASRFENRPEHAGPRPQNAFELDAGETPALQSVVNVSPSFHGLLGRARLDGRLLRDISSFLRTYLTGSNHHLTLAADNILADFADYVVMALAFTGAYERWTSEYTMKGC